MPTSTDIQNLKINTLTEAQFDTAVQGGVIGANELSVLTDANIGAVPQYTTMPTATSSNVGEICQFAGTTDANYTNGYFYKCVSDGGNPATYSWSNIQVQAGGGGSLPSQTGNAGKFLTTDGTDASWSDKPLVNNSTATNAIAIGDSVYSSALKNGTATGVSAQSNIYAASFGYHSSAGSYSVAIGCDATGLSYSSKYISIGYQADCQANNAIMLNVSGSHAINSDANTFKVANANGNFEIMSADGTIPKARLTNALSSTTVTIAVADWNGGTTVNKTISGLTATSVVFVAPDNASQSDYLDAGVYASAQTTDTLTFTCTTTPTSSLTVTVVFC